MSINDGDPRRLSAVFPAFLAYYMTGARNFSEPHSQLETLLLGTAHIVHKDSPGPPVSTTTGHADVEGTIYTRKTYLLEWRVRADFSVWFLWFILECGVTRSGEFVPRTFTR